MIRAKNYENVSKFVKVMTKILWPLFSRTRCIWTPCHEKFRESLATRNYNHI